MTTPLDEVFSPDSAVDAPARSRGSLAKIVFTVALLSVAAVLSVVVGSSAVVGIANAFGIALDARYCSLDRALNCTSVSVTEINRVAGVRLPEATEIEESSWYASTFSGSLSALLETPEAGWVPPAATYEDCELTASCTEQTPAVFERRGITVETEYSPRLRLGDGTERTVFVGRDDAGREWVAIHYTE